LFKFDEKVILNFASSAHSAFFVMLLNPNFTSNFSAAALNLYGKDNIYKCLDKKPMKLLEHLEKVFMPYFTFHLRDLYLRFNLLTPDP
jgi:hypothetical protein